MAPAGIVHKGHFQVLIKKHIEAERCKPKSNEKRQILNFKFKTRRIPQEFSGVMGGITKKIKNNNNMYNSQWFSGLTRAEAGRICMTNRLLRMAQPGESGAGRGQGKDKGRVVVGIFV